MDPRPTPPRPSHVRLCRSRRSRAARLARALVGVLTFSLALPACPLQAEAGGAVKAFHATRRSVSKKVVREGFRPSRARRGGRFGRSIYVSLSKRRAKSERGLKRPGVVRTSISRRRWDRRMETRSMSTEQLRKASGLRDMRGTIKSGVIGPKLGGRLRTAAARQGRIISYRPRGSGKYARANVAIPVELFNKKRGPVGKPRAVK